jgi:hypothetical protein
MRLIAGCVRRLVHPRDRIDRLLALRTVDDQPELYAREWDTNPEGEARQADEVVRHCRTLLARPAVEAVTLLGARGRWLARRARWLHPRRRLAEARVPGAALAGQGRVVATTDHDGH